MALSTALKNMMLDGRKLTYRLKVELKNEDDDWIDFTDRDPKLRQVKISTEKKTTKIVANVGSVDVKNADFYFDYMDDPGDADTITAFGTLATKFSKGFKGVLLRASLVFSMDDGSYETALLGQYKIIDIKTGLSKRAALKLAQDIDFLKSVGVQSMSDGFKQFNNRPISFLVREILRRHYPEGFTDSDFVVPGRIYIETANGLPAFSHYGKPPELDSAGRWRNDVDYKPSAMVYGEDEDLIFFGLGRELWSFDPETEIWTYIDDVGQDASGNDLQVRGLFKWSSTKILVFSYTEPALNRVVKEEHGYIDTTSTPAYTAASGAYFSDIWAGEYVLRDPYHDGAGAATDIKTGLVGGFPSSGNASAGVNLPIPFPHWVRIGYTLGATTSYLGTSAGLRITPADYTTFTGAGIRPALDLAEPCYLAHRDTGTGSATIRSELMAYWGHGPCMAWADNLNDWAGPFLFVARVETAEAYGIRLAGEVKISAINAYTGTWLDIGPTTWSGNESPIYGLQFHKGTSADFLYWINVDWVEEFVNLDYDPASDIDPPIWRIRKGELTDSSGDPVLLTGDISTVWTSGDDIFTADDIELAPITVFPFRPGQDPIGFIVQVMDLDDMGGECFQLYHVNSSFTSATELLTSKLGWGGFSYNTDSDDIFFTDRATGRILRIRSSAPTTINSEGGGEEPVAGAFFEMPQIGGLTTRFSEGAVQVYGCSYPYLPGSAFEGELWPEGKYYFWKLHPELTDRIELFEEGEQTAWTALGKLGEVVNYKVGMDPEGVGFFSPLPTTLTASAFTIDLDGAQGQHFKAEKLKGYDRIINRSQFIPYEVTIGVPSATLDLKGYVEDEEQLYFNGETQVRSESILEKNVSLSCVVEGEIGTAEFKYMVHETLIEARLREATAISGFPRRIRLDNNADIEVGMLVQIGDVDEDSGTAYSIATIEADGDVVLNQDLAEDFEEGTPVLFKSDEQGIWSTEYDTPATYSAETTFLEIGGTGLFLKFTADAEPQRFVVGDRILVSNPGQELKRSRTHKFTVENTASRDRWTLSERNFNNPYMSFTLGKERTQGMVDDEADPHHGFKIYGPLLLQAKPLVVFTLRSRELLPLAADNEEDLYIETVTNNVSKAETTIIARAVSSY